jgi:prephenate dehydratase
MTLITLGPAGTFSHEIAVRLDPDVRLCSSIAGVFAAVAAGEGDGLVPLENSEAGSVGATLVGLADHPVSITGECSIPVRHHLAAADPAQPRERVYAHPQTAEQCSRRLEALGLPVVPTASNAASAVAARNDPSGAALVSDGLAARYGLAVLERDCQNSGMNETRFVRIARTPTTPPSVPCRASLLLDPLEDQAGLLHALLAPFAARAINLTRIESRPSRRGLGRYVFYVDGNCGPGWDDAVAELGLLCTVKDLGRYGRLDLP